MYFALHFPYLLILLLPIICLFWCRPYIKQYYFPKLDWIIKQNSIYNWEMWLKVIISTLLVFALARPFVYDQIDHKEKKGRDLILAIDASGSMAQRGFDNQSPRQSKYETTISLSKEFTQNRLNDNMGVVIFGTFAYTASPLTYDLQALSYMLDMTNIGIAGESTAIGDAIIQSIKTLSYGTASQKAIILLTDGYHNAGASSPKQAVKKAKELGIKIYTIGIGKKSNYDQSLLETIAKETKAKSYSALSAKDLSNIYQSINKLEPSKIRGEKYLNQTLLIYYPLGLAILLLFGWVLSREV